MVLIEAFSVGTPVIAPNHAGFPEIITPDSNGLLFLSGSVDDLAKVLSGALRVDDMVWQRWSVNARHAYLRRYTPSVNYRQLIAIYEKAIDHARGRSQVVSR
jgi:glycosyltransferase involved in cell wall biosynthesis